VCVFRPLNKYESGRLFFGGGGDLCTIECKSIRLIVYASKYIYINIERITIR
jgi:hypothetical protein